MQKLFKLLSVILLTAVIAACSSGGSSRTTGNGTPQIAFNKSSVLVATASSSEVKLILSNPQNLTESLVVVILSSSSSTVATFTTNTPDRPSQCLFTKNHDTCLITINGVTQGSSTISAIASSFTISPLAVTVQNGAVVKGTISLHTPNNQPLYVTRGSTNVMSLSLDDSTGVEDLPITLSSSDSTVAVPSPSSCSLSSTNRTCRFNVNGMKLGAVTIHANASGYDNPTPAQTNVGSAPLLGIVAFSRIGINGLPESVVQVNLPPNPSPTDKYNFNESVSLINSSGIESVQVSLEPQDAGSNMVLFPANPIVTLSSESSTLVVQGQLWQGYTSGDTYILESSTSYTVTGESQMVNQGIPFVVTHFHIVPSIVPATRSITFVNNCSESVWIGVTSSSVKAIDSNGDGHTYCDPAQFANKCPTGSSCLFAESSAGVQKYSCYWDAPLNPSNKYQLSSGESVVTYVESTWYDKIADVQWSGNFFGRTKCDPVTGICQTGNCKIGESSTLACVVNVGASPQPVTLAEITMQPDTVDSYDVSAIPGVNLPMSFGPDPKSNPTVSSYSCGTAGDLSAQGTLNASPWTFPESSFNGESISYFTIVESGGVPCTPGGTACSGTQACGMTFGQIAAGSFATSCGNILAYVTPNGIATIEPESTYAAPPYYNGQSWSTKPMPTLNNWPIYQLNLCKTDAANCNPGESGTINTGYGPYKCNGKSMYTESANTCGCTNWNGIATPTQNCSSNNPAWDSRVKPFIEFMKKACPTCYSYPYDDKASSYSCKVSGSAQDQYVNVVGYVVTYCPGGKNL